MDFLILAASPAAEAFLLFGLIVSIFWMVIGWRAMKDHEELAVEAKRVNERLEAFDLPDVGGSLRSQSKAYREFIMAHPQVERLSSEERHDPFREWEAEQA